MVGRGGLAMIGFVLLLLPCAVAAEPVPESAILEARSSISETERQQREQLAHLFVINKKIKDIAKKKAQLNDRLMSQEAAVRAMAQDVSELEERSEKHKAMLNKRLRQLYQGRERNDFEWLFSAQTPVELERNHRFLRRMIDSDHKYVREYLNHLQALRKKRKELSAQVARLLGMQKGVQTQERQLTEQMRAKSKLVAELRKVKDSKLSELKSLRAGGAADLGEPNPDALEFAFFERKGSLRPPVSASVTREYGTFVDPQFRFRLMHKGSFYTTAKPQVVSTIFGGRVVLARTVPGFGPTTIIDHGDNYYSVYAFASQLKVKEGATVKEGEIVAMSGHNSPLFGPGLYFEIRHFTDAIDPRPWIKESVIKTAQGEK